MLTWLAPLLRCPSCAGKLKLEENTFQCESCADPFPVLDGVPRFVPAENYAASFGLQWNRFAKTQLDSNTGTTISRDRFLAQTCWTREDLQGALVLDAGCGAGRFVEVALALGARVVAVDFSTAVDACWRNLGSQESLAVIQADLTSLPFAPGSFDFVFSFGVVQHTPDVRNSIANIIDQVKPGGRVAVDVYEANWRQFAHPKFWLRPFTTRIPSIALFNYVERFAPPLLHFSRSASRLPLLGRLAKRAIPVANYEGVFPLRDQHLVEFAILDTFDWLSPRYDQPQTATTLRRWLAELGLEDIEVDHPAHLTGRGRRPSRSA